MQTTSSPAPVASATDAYSAAVESARVAPDAFWADAARDIDWDRAPSLVRDARGWFPDARINTCRNAVDRHVAAGRGDDLALIVDSPVTGTIARYSFAELQTEVARTAGMIRAAGVQQSDRVILYMPMIPQALIAMLACARIGAIHSVVFGGFAAPELAKRIDDAKPALILTASCGIEGARVVPYKPMIDAAIDLATHPVPAVILFQRPMERAPMVAGRDRDWADALAAAEPADCVPIAATDPLYILYTSGTTGIPKGVVRDNGGHAVALAWSMRHVYGARPGDVFWAASDIGWVVGHSYIVYGPLIAGCTTVLFEGKPVGTPDAGTFWRVIRDHGVRILFTAPTAIRAIRREDGEAAMLHDRGGVPTLDALFLAGERADPETVAWAERQLQVPVIDHWWQTELGWPAIATCRGLGRTATLAGSAGHPVPGFDIVCLDESHAEVAVGEIGELAIRLPLPPGALTTLWQRDDHFRDSYLTRHPGFYTAGDAGMIDDDGRVHVMSRIDDLINVAGHRLSTGQMEQVVAEHPDVAECAVVGVPDALKGETPVGFLILRAAATRDPDAVTRDVIDRVRAVIGPVAAFKAAVVVDKLPKTRSGKILRASLRALATGADIAIPPTIEDADAIRAVRAGLNRAGLVPG